MKAKNGSNKIRRSIQALAILFTLVLAGCGTTSSEVQGTSGYLDTVTVTGFGEAYGVPDMATIQFGYTKSDTTISVALAQANETVDRISAALVERGIAASDIQTTNFSVWPEDQYDPMTGLPTGERLYRVENTIQVVIRDIEMVAPVVEMALDQGANNVYGLTFGIADTNAIAVKARTAAVEDGRERAMQLADELGLGLGEARIANEIYDSGNYFDTPEYARGIGGGGGAPAINEGQLVVRVRVNITFDLVR